MLTPSFDDAPGSPLATVTDPRLYLALCTLHLVEHMQALPSHVAPRDYLNLGLIRVTQGELHIHPSPMREHICFPLHWNTIDYGSLLVNFPPHRHAWVAHVGMALADTCAWMLFGVEQALTTSLTASQQRGLLEHTQQLTPQERLVWHMMTAGHPITTIAHVLHIQVGTVRNHQHHLYTKLGVGSADEAIALGHLADLSSFLP